MENQWIEKLAIQELCARYCQTIDAQDCGGWDVGGNAASRARNSAITGYGHNGYIGPRGPGKPNSMEISFASLRANDSV